MRARSALLLAVCGIVLLALGLVYGIGPAEQTRDTPAGQLAFPDLAGKLQQATQIVVLHHGATVTMARKGSGADAVWGLPDRGFYPVQPGKLRALLAGLTELRLDEPRTADPADYARLGVEDAGGKDAQSTLLRVLDAKGEAIAALILGHARGTDSLYVRRPGEVRSWLATGHLEAGTNAADWLDHAILDMPAAKVAGVAVTRGGATLRFTRQGNALVLTEPADHPKLDTYKVEEIGRALDGLTFDDVRPAPAPGEALGHSVFTTSDGATITADISKAGTDIWAMFAADDNDAARVKGWAYKLPGWKEQALVPTLDDLKAAEPPPAAPK